MLKENKSIKFQNAKSAILKFLLGGALIFSASNAAYATNNAKGGNKKAKTEQTAKKKGTDYSVVKLDSIQDMNNLFNKSLHIIFSELILEEVPKKESYDDKGRFKGKKNTFGVGSTYSPLNIANYNNSNIQWFHLASNPKTFGKKTVLYEDMLKLVVGWGKYRTKTQNPGTQKFLETSTVLERMFNKLKGCELRPNEFAALYCACYNNETNINTLCPYIAAHYKNKVACANKLMTWWKNGPANNGTKDRCEFECLVWLNCDGFCEAMLNMPTCPSKNASCVNVKSVKQTFLTTKNYKDYSNKAKQAYLKVIYKDAVTPKMACKDLNKYFSNPIYTNDSDINFVQAEYDAAVKLYNSGKYKDALAKFLKLEQDGASGADLFNDIAITYLNIGKYDECIQYCQKILQTGEVGEYAKACYNAGSAYEKKNNFEKALINYKKALEYFEKYGIDRAGDNIDYKTIYKNCITRIEQKTKQIVKQTKKKMK